MRRHVQDCLGRQILDLEALRRVLLHHLVMRAVVEREKAGAEEVDRMTTVVKSQSQLHESYMIRTIHLSLEQCQYRIVGAQNHQDREVQHRVMRNRLYEHPEDQMHPGKVSDLLIEAAKSVEFLL